MTTGEVYRENYDKLVLSPGAMPVAPKIPGIRHPAIFTLRNIPDTDRIKNYIDEKHPKDAVIIGAGFIGLEMAENLSRLGIRVSIVEALPHLMAYFDPDMAAILQEELNSEVNRALPGVGAADLRMTAAGQW